MAIEDQLMAEGLTAKTIGFDLGNPAESDPRPLALMVVLETSPTNWDASEAQAFAGAMASNCMIRPRYATKYVVQRTTGPPKVLRVGLFIS